GTGPMLSELEQRYPDVIFTGKRIGEDLAEAYASADVFVFPSLTDTFGIVLIEAMASGLPVAAFPVTGPIDNVTSGVTGFLDDDLAKAARLAMHLDRSKVRAHGQSYSWENAGRLFMSNIESALFSKQGRRVPARAKRRLLRRTVSEL
ncbi:MAG: glycosyltransferase, partial [Pseudomonadota bacterium]